MKRITSIIIASLFISTSSFSTDRIVAEGGQGGAFETITAAITAAVSGDRILIYPKENGGHYSENISITNKSIQLLSAEEGTRYKISGDITFTPATAGLEFVIIQAELLSGSNIASAGSSPVGTRSKVIITDCLMHSGNINFDFNYFDCNIANNELLGGQIGIRFGRVIGNTITSPANCSHGIYVNPDALASNDICYVVGNTINMTTAGCGNIAGIYWLSSSHFYYIANNFVDTNGSLQIGIYVTATKSSTADKNRIYNNSIYHNGNANNWGLYLNSHASPTEVFNNTILIAGPAVYAFGSNTQSVNDLFQYNYTNLNSANSFAGILNDGTNVQGAVFTMSTTTGEISAGPQINGGSPDDAFTDLDLTRNDADCYGGSYSRENFIQAATGAVTTFVIAPRRVLAGQTINISADGYDR